MNEILNYLEGSIIAPGKPIDLIAKADVTMTVFYLNRLQELDLTEGNIRPANGAAFDFCMDLVEMGYIIEEERLDQILATLCKEGETQNMKLLIRFIEQKGYDALKKIIHEQRNKKEMDERS